MSTLVAVLIGMGIAILSVPMIIGIFIIVASVRMYIVTRRRKNNEA